MKTIVKATSLLHCCLLIIVCSAFVHAQSGRRQARVEPAAPVPTPTPEPSPKPKADKKESDVIIAVGADRTGGFSYFPYSYFDAVVMGCAETLKKSSAQVDAGSGSQNRGDAIKKAKSDSKTYVVFLQLNAHSMSGSVTNTNPDDIELEFTVFAPGTGKVVTSGRSYQNATRAGPVVVGPSSTGVGSGLYREQMLRRAGEDAGARILRALHLDVAVMN